LLADQADGTPNPERPDASPDAPPDVSLDADEPDGADGSSADDLGADVARSDLPDTATNRICDGSNFITFQYSVYLAPPHKPYGSENVWENGAPFLYIDGHCRYWSFGTGGFFLQADGETRTGTLTFAEAEELATDVRLADWSTWSGSHRYVQTADNTDAVFGDGTNFVSCDNSCDFPGAPTDLVGIYHAVLPWLERLYARGTPLAGSVRATLVDVDAVYPDWRTATAAWPLDRPLAPFVVPYTYQFPQASATRVDQPDADKLRALRAQKQDILPPNNSTPFVPLRGNQGHLYGLYVRDVLPFERDDGRVPSRTRISVPPPP
jgi:hypothetical protein